MMNEWSPDKSPEIADGVDLPSRRDILRVLFRHKKKVAGFFLSAVLLTALATILVTPTFVSDSKLLIRVGRESVSMDPSVLGPTMDVFQSRMNEINSEIGIMTSPVVIERVIKEIGVATYLGTDKNDDTEVLEGAISRFRNRLSVSSDTSSNIISLQFKARNPALAQQSLDTLIDKYLDRHIEVHSTQASPAFFEKRAADLLAELTGAEDFLEQFRDERKISAIGVQQSALISQISGLQIALQETTGQASASKARISALQNSIDSRPQVAELSRVTGISNPAADTIKTRLIDLRFKETDLSARYPDDERALIDVRQQISVALDELAKEQETRSQVTTGRDQNGEALRLDLVTERSNLYAGMARLQSISDELELRESALSQLATDEIELARLERAVEISDQEYREYIAHYQRADISAALDSDRVSNVSVIQPPSYSSNAIAPRKKLNLLLSLFIGLFGAVGIAYLSELLDDSLKSRDDVAKRLGLPVLATLSTEEFQSCT